MNTQGEMVCSKCGTTVQDEPCVDGNPDSHVAVPIVACGTCDGTGRLVTAYVEMRCPMCRGRGRHGGSDRGSRV